MRNLNLKVSLWILLVISALAWFSFAYIGKVDLSKVADFFGLIPKVVTFDVIAITIFTKWLWRWKYLRGWLVPFPDLNGSWLGEIRSDWIDKKTGVTIPPIPVMLTVRQTFFSVSFVMQTAEMRSDSYMEGFQIDTERQIKQVSYCYTSRPKISLQNRSTPHDGAVVFQVIESNERKLIGRYWTERKTTGEIEINFRSKVILDEIPAEFRTHPIAKLEE